LRRLKFFAKGRKTVVSSGKSSPGRLFARFLSSGKCRQRKLEEILEIAGVFGEMPKEITIVRVEISQVELSGICGITGGFGLDLT
jgi:hypothetical protein